ncbi:MAG: hypothetical protein UNLARM2_0332 [Candidatus Micrarchaeum acidiphilum ARMAN-2]|jgi:hypothetical protein|uniref:Phosphotyrosine protein phosphatase I domain-containing protein n=1 Tax=Candidatus Micrarchaeum acidiphilum ARMAN-2 TaxID=425595 RepID=C7DGY3_MICA2|nr:MAG: hypothetical protein UNLARM2_0332 [Candidatus Micrarchaeum acidiphilum ARMAN-2]
MVAKNDLPGYLQKSDKLILWDIVDPESMDYDGHVKIRDMIYKKVQVLVKNIIK